LAIGIICVLLRRIMNIIFLELLIFLLGVLAKVYNDYYYIIILLYYYIIILLLYLFMNVIFKINTFREVYKLPYNIEIIILIDFIYFFICILRIVILLFKVSKFKQNKDNF
jgi:hypothetical protein